MTTNPNLLFALESITTTSVQASSIPITVATPLGPHRTLARANDPRHGCINGIKISTCKMCAGHVLRSKVPCTGCKGTGFVGARCSACAIGAVIAQRVLIKEIAASVLTEDDKRAKNPQKQTSTLKEAPKTKDASAGKDTQARKTTDKNVSDEEVETSEEE